MKTNLLALGLLTALVAGCATEYKPKVDSVAKGALIVARHSGMSGIILPSVEIATVDGMRCNYGLPAKFLLVDPGERELLFCGDFWASPSYLLLLPRIAGWNAKVSARLEAGHAYEIRQEISKIDHSSYHVDVWLEDLATNQQVGGKGRASATPQVGEFHQ